MATAYTSLLGLALPVTGELSGSWGDTVNDGITSLLDSAISGTTSLTTDADVILTTTTGAANEARQAIILWNPASGTVTRNVTAPAQSKIYTVINASGGTQSIVFRGVGPTTGVTVVKGESAVVAWNGTDFIKIGNIGGGGVFTTLSVSGNVTLSGGTANGVAYLNGSKVLTTGSALTFDGTNLAVGLSSSEGFKLNINGSAQIRGGGGLFFANSAQDASANIQNAGASGVPTLNFILSSAEQMRLTSTGLGIGTSSPSAKLHVSGTEVRLQGSASFYSFYDTAGTTRAGYIQNNTGALNFVGELAQPMQFYTNNTERMRLDSPGNLGLGVTPSAWGGGYKAMQIAGYVAFAQRPAGSGDLILSWNAFNTSGNTSGSGYVYKNTGDVASSYEQNGAHRWYVAPSGTAGNAISFTQAMTLDSSGNLGVGTTSSNGMRLNITGYSPELYDPTTSSAKFPYLPKGSQEIFEVSLGATPKAGYANLINISVNDDLGGDGVYYGAVGQSGGNSAAHFVFGRRTGGTSWAESARIDSSGNLLVGATSVTGAKFLVAGNFDSNFGQRINGTNSTTGYMIQFQTQGTERGYIVSTSGGTTYATSSDYRLKNTVSPMTGALAKVAALKPCTYKWNSDGSDGQGFIAHELAEVCPQAVTGEKDAVNEDGSIKAQGIDTSFLVATLTAAIQEQQALIQTLTARVAALESN